MSAGASIMGSALGVLTSLADSLTGRRLSILVFHRVLPTPDPLFPNEIDAQRFDRLMQVVARGFTVMTLGRAVRHLQAGSLPPRAMVITFDDGYADNATVAQPILARHRLEATIFVASGFLDGGRMWNDTIIETIRRSQRPSIDLSEFGLGLMDLSTHAQRRAVIEALLPVVKYQDPGRRAESLRQLLVLAGTPRLPDDLMMTCAQLQDLHRAGIEIGGHTIGHPILTTLSDEAARAEIDGGRQALQSMLGAPVDVFAYPNGGPDRDYDQRHVEMVRGLGFCGAVTTAHGTAGPQADCFQLPRYSPWGGTLAHWGGRLVASRTWSGFKLADPALQP